jgi:hypothetical protein
MRVHHIYVVIKSEEKWIYCYCCGYLLLSLKEENLKTIYVNFVVLKSEEKFKTLSYVKSEKRFKN